MSRLRTPDRGEFTAVALARLVQVRRRSESVLKEYIASVCGQTNQFFIE